MMADDSAVRGSGENGVDLPDPSRYDRKSLVRSSGVVGWPHNANASCGC
jgi:hypothetical protein